MTSSLVNDIDSMINDLEKSLGPEKSKKDTPSQPTNKHKKLEMKEEVKEEIESKCLAGTQPNPVGVMPLEDRVRIALSVGEECQKEEELRALLANKLTRPIAYDGFEPSGRMHIAQGVLKSICVNKLTSVGCDFVFWVADWFALLNSKMGGDLKKIRDVGEYMIQVWKAAGMDMDHVYFRWASDAINEESNDYWLRVIDISKKFTITRLKRCCTIMGRQEADDMPAANLMYACMQCADIFFLKADICQLGMDQKKVNMLAREYSDKMKKKRHPPVVISHHMLMGLQKGQEKMSKSVDESAIFMEDSADDVRRKIKCAYGPPGEVAGNPILDYTKHIVFGKFGSLKIKRKPENGGDVLYNDYQTLEKDYVEGKLHIGDLKPAVAEAINDILEPVRQHFKNDPKAKKLLAKIKKYKTTR